MIKKIIKIFRIPEQTIAIVPFLFGALDSHFYNLTTLLILGIGLFLLSVSFFVINEYVDSFDTDQSNIRKEKTFNFLKNKKLIFGIYAILTIVGSAIFIYYKLYLPLLLILFFGNFYSVPPLRFKSRFPWDMIAPMIAWGVPYSLAYSLQGLPYNAMLNVGSISFALFGIPMQGIHYLADAESDKKAGISNFCTVMGYRNFLRLIDKIAIGGLLGFVYLVYRNEQWWYYPVILASIYELLIIGYARAAIYFPSFSKLQSIANRSYAKGIKVFLLIVIFQIWALLKISGRI